MAGVPEMFSCSSYLSGAAEVGGEEGGCWQPHPCSWAVYHKACLARCPARLPKGVEEGWLFLDEGDLT